ncbi:MAG: transcription-repair coupling factor [Bacteriovoracia bacterium]
MSSRLTLEVSKSLSTSTPIQKIEGLSASSSAYFLSHLLTQLVETEKNNSVLYICATTDAAAVFLQDLKTFLEIFGKEHLVSKVDFFPGWEFSPYSAFQPSLKTRLRRLRTLERILSGESRCVVTSVESLFQRCPAPEWILDNTHALKVGSFFSREDLTQKFLRAGYVLSDPVEDPGQFSFRGNLLDFFSPAEKKPVRIEFFGDDIESIRFFDSVSQKSITAEGEIKNAKIIPVQDFCLDQQTIASASAKIKKFCDENEIRKQERDRFFDAIEKGQRDPSLDYLLSYFSNQELPWLGDYLSLSGSLVKTILFDSFSVENTFDRNLAELKNDHQVALEEKKIVCHWASLFCEDLLSKINALRPLRIEPFSKSEDQSSSVLKLKTMENEDLAKTQDKASVDLFEEKLLTWKEQDYKTIMVCSSKSQLERIQFILKQREIDSAVSESGIPDQTTRLQLFEGQLSKGFRLSYDSISIVTDSEVFGQKKAHVRSSSRERDKTDFFKEGISAFLSSLEDLNPEDLIVHRLHGIGRYKGLVKIDHENVPHDFLLLEYSGGDRLYLPIYRLDQVQKYLNNDGATVVSLDKLGSGQFEKTKAKVKKELQELAHHLLNLYAQRAMRKGFSFSQPNDDYREFEARFPYAETQDQLKSIDDVIHDMHSDRIMDRLICGDVGYGKTEVAMRAAYLAALDGKQVAILVPTTVLALQHERSFKERFKNTPVRIGVLSRFKSRKEISDTLSEVKEGKVDLVIGTHRLLSKDVQFKDLGLLIVDEEQRFGVEHKEKLKALKTNTDVLTLTATPIPRTLHLSLMGLRDISIIRTPPVDRLSVRTYVSKFEENLIRKAILTELGRGGQVFFIHNRVQSIYAMEDRIKKIVPEAKIIVAHGQQDEKTLEERMLSFYNREAQVLLCTTIIESGLDIPSANTMIINRADMFGLSQLYQLRGRVGRSQTRAYCYLLLPEAGGISEESKTRLEVIQKFADLGSGFKVASHDLELRGGGDIIGKSQSGHIAAVGYELFIELLDETVHEIKGQKTEQTFDPEIKLPFAAIISSDYIPDVHQRLGYYKKLSSSTTPDALDAYRVELEDRYGSLPEEVLNLIWLIRIKHILVKYHIKSLVVGKEKLVLDASEAVDLDPQKLISAVQSAGGPKSDRLQVTKESKILMRIDPQKTSIASLYETIDRFFASIRQD